MAVLAVDVMYALCLLAFKKWRFKMPVFVGFQAD